VARYSILVAVGAQQEEARYDDAAPRRATRKQRETGLWFYVPAAELRKIEIDPHDPPTTYRIFAMSKHSLAIRLYGD
jgi:hypothetical protein